MNQRIKEMWVKALKSDEYIQGQGALRKVMDGITGHCCLGVLCDIHSKETGGVWVEGETPSRMG